MPRLLYLVHDLSYPAVRRRLIMVANRAACDRRNWATDEADRKNLVSWLAGLAPAEPGKTADHFPISSSFAI
jgi:succinoglycan biosynthesis protein ExoL